MKEWKRMTKQAKRTALFGCLFMASLIWAWLDKGLADRVVFTISVCTGIIVVLLDLMRMEITGKIYKS